jgi:hypothetical protein
MKEDGLLASALRIAKVIIPIYHGYTGRLPEIPVDSAV